MTRSILFIAVLLITFSDALANTDPYKVTIPDNTKVVGTYSADFGATSTLHIVLLKNQDTKNFDLLPFFVSENNEVRKLATISVEREPSIISHHSNGSTVSMVSYDEKKKELTVYDLNTETGIHAIHTENDIKSPDNIFRLDDKTYLVHQDERRRKLNVRVITYAKGQDNISFDIDKSLKKEFELFTKFSQDAINRNEFVKLGSINKRKAYLSEGQLIYTMDDEKSGLTEAMIFHLDGSAKVEMSKFQNKALDKIKDYNSYIYNGDLFSAASNKEGMIFKVFDMNSGDETKSFSLEEAMKKANSGEANSSMQEYLREVSKAKMKSTVTVNATKEGKLLVRVDQVDKNTYNYHYNWWFHHWMWQQQIWHQQMMQQNIQNTINSLPKFTPNGEYYDEYYNVFGPLKEEDGLEFVLDTNFDVAPEAGRETKFAIIDRDKYLKEFEDQKNLKEITAGFTSTNFRYIYMDKKTKEVFIAFKELDGE